MKTFTTLTNLATNLTNNTSTDNQSLMGQIISDQHRYLIQKFFDNERVYTTKTVGAEDYTLTAAPIAGATSATMTVVWPHNSAQQLVNFSTGEQRTVFFTQGSASIRWSASLDEAATTAISTVGVQSYPIPPTVSKIKNNTITIGQLQYTPAPVQSIQEWTMLNMLPYNSNIPNYFYIYNNQVNFWPIPSSSGNIITFNYKARVPDLSFADYSTGTLSNITVGSNIITGVATAWNTPYPVNVDLKMFNLFIKINPPSGEGIWYQIQQFNSATEVVLTSPIQNAPSSTAATYVIGQLPLLQEDFQDMLVYGAVQTYYSSIVDNDKMYSKYKTLYDERLTLLDAYAANKSVNVDLGAQPIPNNPNLFIYSNR